MSVIIYSTPRCPWCRRVKEYLEYQDIEYTDYNIYKDYNAAREMIRKSKQKGVPVLDINGHIVIGFNKKSIDKLLNL